MKKSGSTSGNTQSKKQCVNCTCATTGFCPRGVGVNIPRDESAVAADTAQTARPNQALRQQLQQLPGNRKRMRF